jgi:hypothetical protein
MLIYFNEFIFNYIFNLITFSDLLIAKFFSFLKSLLGGLCLSKREAANGRGLTISCNSLGLIELVDNVLY